MSQATEGRRIGRFSIPRRAIEERPDEVKVVLVGCIVVEARSTYMHDEIEYIALHDDFELVGMMTEAPEYRPVVMRRFCEERLVTVIKRTWERVGPMGAMVPKEQRA